MPAVYLIQPSSCDKDGTLLKGRSLTLPLRRHGGGSDQPGLHGRGGSPQRARHPHGSDGPSWAENVIRHTLLGDPEQSKFQKLRVGTHDRFELDLDCGEN
jgi:hypothetical protein